MTLYNVTDAPKTGTPEYVAMLRRERETRAAFANADKDMLAMWDARIARAERALAIG